MAPRTADKQITGLATALPDRHQHPAFTAASIAPRATIWRTSTFDPHVSGGTVTLGASLPSDEHDHSADALNYVMTKPEPRSRLRRSADHVAGTLCGLRRRHDRDSAPAERDLAGQAGLLRAEYIGGGKRAEIVLDGGIGSNMPANTTFGINTDTPAAALSPQPQLRQVVRGDGQMPIDKDAICAVHRLDGRTDNDQSASQLENVR